MEVQDADLGARLAQIRKARGLRLEQAATLLHISKGTLCRYEHGTRHVPYPMLSELKYLYDVSYNTLLDLSLPIPSWLRCDYSKNRSNLNWHIEKMLGEFQLTGRYYLLCWKDGWVYRVRHQQPTYEILLVSTYHPGQLKPPETAYSVREFERIRVETVINLLNQARGWVE